MAASFCNYLHSVFQHCAFWQSHPYPLRGVWSSNTKLGPTPKAASAQLLERAQMLLEHCLLFEINSLYFYGMIDSAIITGSITDDQLMAIYQSCGLYSMKRSCSLGTLFQDAIGG